MSHPVASQTSCPYCTTSLGEAPSHACAGCGTRHHADCWTDNGGCAVALCTAGPVGSDPTLRPPVSERPVLVVALDEDGTATETAGSDHPFNGASPLVRTSDSDNERLLVLAVLGAVALLLLLLLLVVVAFA